MSLHRTKDNSSTRSSSLSATPQAGLRSRPMAAVVAPYALLGPSSSVFVSMNCPRDASPWFCDAGVDT